MERLTGKWMDGSYYAFDPIDIADNEYSKINYEKLIAKLGEYEQAEEDGLLIRLPCKVGDVVYVIQSNGKIAERKADMMFFGVLWDEYGKEWFTSKAEAEQALAKMKGE